MWGLFALGVFVGMVGATTALLAFVVVEDAEKEGKMMKDFFSKPIKVVITSNIRPGDYVHDIADPASLLDIEKRKGYVMSVASKVKSGRTVLRLIGRKSSLEVPADANVVITRASPLATQGRKGLS